MVFYGYYTFFMTPKNVQQLLALDVDFAGGYPLDHPFSQNDPDLPKTFQF